MREKRKRWIWRRTNLRTNERWIQFGWTRWNEFFWIFMFCFLLKRCKRSFSDLPPHRRRLNFVKAKLLWRKFYKHFAASRTWVFFVWLTPYLPTKDMHECKNIDVLSSVELYLIWLCWHLSLWMFSLTNTWCETLVQMLLVYIGSWWPDQKLWTEIASRTTTTTQKHQ